MSPLPREDSPSPNGRSLAFVTGSLPTLDSRRSIAVALFLLLAAVFFLPYLVPVTPSVSLAYLVGYNNQAAFLIFSVGSVVFATLCRKRFAESISADQRLGFPSLVLALFVAMACCAYRMLPAARHQIGGEAAYTINRIQMLLQGLRPYRDFEFAYGPAHLYIPVLFMRLTHGSVMRGYYTWLILQWLLGTAMLWSAVRLLQLPFPHRRIVFWIIFTIQLPGLMAEGTAYTPTRTIGSAFFVVIVASLINHRKKSLLIASTAVLCVAASLAISPEQGIAVFAGLFVWFLLLITVGDSTLTIRDAAIFLFGSSIVLLGCWRLGEFSTLLVFSKGVYSFPLLPSPTNILILTSYVAAACAGIHALIGRRFDSVSLPLFLAGFALLPAAMGRCDYGHLLLATPAWLLGVAAIDARPTLRIWWSPLATVLMAVPGIAIPLYQRHQVLLSRQSPASATRKTVYSPYSVIFAHNSCPVIYRTVNVSPNLYETAAQDCLDTGRYWSMINAFTPGTVDTMLRDLDRRPLHPLLFWDRPLAEQLHPSDAYLVDLYLLELSPWIPSPRNPPFTYQKLQTYIEENYTPSPNPIAGFRVWYPKPHL
jgi:hypothetical protein